VKRWRWDRILPSLAVFAGCAVIPAILEGNAGTAALFTEATSIQNDLLARPHGADGLTSFPKPTSAPSFPVSFEVPPAPIMFGWEGLFVETPAQTPPPPLSGRAASPIQSRGGWREGAVIRRLTATAYCMACNSPRGSTATSSGDQLAKDEPGVALPSSLRRLHNRHFFVRWNGRTILVKGKDKCGTSHLDLDPAAVAALTNTPVHWNRSRCRCVALWGKRQVEVMEAKR
jgi:hypothetical protein